MKFNFKGFSLLAGLVLSLTLAGCGEKISENRKQSLSGGGCISATPLTTVLGGTNSLNGAMFDIVAGASDVRIDTLHPSDESAAGIPGNWAIYFRAAPFSGFETTSGAWTLLGSAIGVISNGPGVTTPLPIPVNIRIPAGETYAFHVTKTDGFRLKYTNGTVQGAVYASDGIISVLEGVGTGYPFASSIPVRIWNGVINYSTCT